MRAPCAVFMFVRTFARGAAPLSIPTFLNHAWPFPAVVRWIVCIACVSCDVSQPVSDLECVGGRNCIDASIGGDDEVAVNADASPPMTTPEADAAITLVCPGACLPDDPRACLAPELLSQVVVEAGVPSVALDAASAGNGTASDALDASVSWGGDASLLSDAAAGSDQESMAEAGLDANVSSDAAGRALDVLDAAGTGGGGAGSSQLSCQLAWDQNELVSGCAASGAGGEGSACASARDCRPGFGCVGAAGAGQCLPYCCEGQTRCGQGRYCAQRPMRAPQLVAQGAPPMIPVCAVAEQCSLTLGPCAEGEPCSCSEGRACTVVDRAGTTACVQPGSGKEGDACPCAAGYFCSQGTQTCLKFCNTQDPTSACGDRWCQPGPSGFPAGWGLCVDHVE